MLTLLLYITKKSLVILESVIFIPQINVAAPKSVRNFPVQKFLYFQNVEKKGGSAMDLAHMLTNSLGNVINEIIFGYKFPPEDHTWNWFRQIQEEGCKEMGVAGIVNFLPFFRYFQNF